MKLIKTANNKYKLTKKAWKEIGNRAGWLKQSQNEVLDDLYEKHQMQRIDKPVFVSLYETSRAYGGPEEGGWWYTNYNLESSKKFYDREEAENFAERLEGEIEQQNLNEESLSSTRGFESIPESPEVSKSLYPEGYIPLGFSGSAKNYIVMVEDVSGENETKERPHYE